MGQKKSELLIQPRRNKSVSVRIGELVDQVGGVAQLAKLAGVSETAVRKWKSNESEPTVSRLVRLARCTGVDVGWLATGQGPKTSEDMEDRASSEPVGASVFIYKEGLDPEIVRATIEIIDRRLGQKLNPQEKADLIVDLLLEEQANRKEETAKLLKQGPPQPAK